MSTCPIPALVEVPEDSEAALFEKVAQALRGIRFGEVVVVVVDGHIDRIDRVEKSRPYRAPRDARR